MGNPKPETEPAEPFEFEQAVEIARPAADVYALIDWADPRNAQRVRGNRVERLGSAPDRFRLELDLVPGHAFDITVTYEAPGRCYAFEIDIRPPLGRLLKSCEVYEVQPLGRSSCRLSLTVSASFEDNLPEDVLAAEVMMMAVACENALVKLKVQAEQGVDAVHALEARQMEGEADWVQPVISSDDVDAG